MSVDTPLLKFNPRPAGGGGVWTPPPPPSGFSRIAKKNGGAQRRRVFTHLIPHLFRNFCENLDPMPCEVRSPGQVKWPNYKTNFQSRNGYNVSGKVMKLSAYDEVISAYKTYISDFWYRWPQVRSFLRPPHYKSMGKKSTLLYLLWRKRFWVESYRIGQLWTIWEKKMHYLPLQRSFEVTRGHQPSFANNFWSKRDRDVGLVSVRSSWPGKSTDMQYDPFRSSRDLGLTWPEVKLWPWPFKAILYMVRRALTRQTRWYQIRCSIFKIKDFIVEKPFWKILEFWPLETAILTWAKNDRNDFEMIFRELLNAAFRFSLRRPGAEIMGGVQTPPPPSRRWKIQRPSRARVKREMRPNSDLKCQNYCYFKNSNSV